MKTLLLLTVAIALSGCASIRQARINALMTKVYCSDWCDTKAVDQLHKLGVSEKEIAVMFDEVLSNVNN